MTASDASATGMTRADAATGGIAAQTRTVTAFFDTREAAQTATDDLVAAGIPRQHVTVTEGAGTAEVSEPIKATKDKSFWDELKDLVLPDEDRHSYAEGLSRGGFLLSVKLDEANHTRALDILDRDGAVDLDEREGQWETEGWQRFGDASALRRDAADPVDPSAIAPMPPVPDSTFATNAPRAELGAAAAGDAARMTGAHQGAASTAVRDANLDRARLRSFITAPDGSTRETTPAGQRFAAATDRSKIAEHMDVIASDGTKIGTVDHLDGPDRIKLAKNTSPDGQHHYVPLSWVDHVDAHVHLNKSLAEIKASQ